LEFYKKEFPNTEVADECKFPEAPPGLAWRLNHLLWTSVKEWRVVRRYPDLLELDPTSKTNGKNLVWVFIVGCNSNGETCVWAAVLLGTGELKANFRFILYALVNIYGSKVMRAVALPSSDGDSKITDPIDEFIASGMLGGNRCRCFWHVVQLRGQ
jgi:hypothetical protein